MNPVVGQELFLLNVGNAARHAPQVLKPVVVKRVGRKYFTVVPPDKPDAKWQEIDFHLEDGRQKTTYTPSFIVYENPQQWKHEQEAASIVKQVREAFAYGKKPETIGLEKLRIIAAQLQ